MVSFPSRDESSLLGQTQETYRKSENEFAVSNPHGIVWTMPRLWRGPSHRITDVARGGDCGYDCAKLCTAKPAAPLLSS